GAAAPCANTIGALSPSRIVESEIFPRMLRMCLLLHEKRLPLGVAAKKGPSSACEAEAGSQEIVEGINRAILSRTLRTASQPPRKISLTLPRLWAVRSSHRNGAAIWENPL